MKRLILMGGRPWFGADKGESFVNTLFRYFPKEVKVAFCIFAQPESEWEETRSVNKKMFTKYGGSRNIQYQTMTTENFVEVSAWADVIYIPGGNPYVLAKTVMNCGDVLVLWDGKVLAGSSAGADLFCQGFVYLQEKTIGQALGWLPFGCIPHWRSEDFEGFTPVDWDWAEQASIKHFAGATVLCIPESEFVEFTVN